MRFTLSFAFAAAWCVLSILVIPHHRRRPDSFRKTTLGAIYVDFVKEARMLLRPRNQLLFLLGLTGIWSTFYPALLTCGIRLGAGQVVFILGGLVALLGAAVNFLLIVLSHTDFVGGSKCKEQTILTWLLPLIQALVGLASVVTGFSAGWTSAVRGFILG